MYVDEERLKKKFSKCKVMIDCKLLKVQRQTFRVYSELNVKKRRPTIEHVDIIQCLS